MIPQTREGIYLKFVKRYQTDDCLNLKDTLSLFKRVEVSWSGGRCSTVALHMVHEVIPSVKVFYVDTGVDFPETYLYIKEFSQEFGLNLTVLRPKTTFWKIAEKHGFPKRRTVGCEQSMQGVPHVPFCCKHLKEKPLREGISSHGIDLNITGMRAGESRPRMFTIARLGLIYPTKTYGTTSFHPIGLWTSERVEKYLRKNNIPVNPVYAKGQNRTGCWTCTAFTSWYKTLSKSHPRLFRFLVGKIDPKLLYKYLDDPKYHDGLEPTPFY